MREFLNSCSKTLGHPREHKFGGEASVSLRKNCSVGVGQLGLNVTTEQGIKAARGVAIDLLATLNLAVGDLNKIKRIVKLMVLVNSAPAFTEQHLVANGASELLVQVFGDNDRHARSALGVAQVPFGAEWKESE